MAIFERENESFARELIMIRDHRQKTLAGLIKRDGKLTREQVEHVGPSRR